MGAELEEYTTLLSKEYQKKKLQDLSPLQLPWNSLNLRGDMLSRNLVPDQPVRGNYSLVDVEGETFLKVDLVNLITPYLRL